MELTYIWLTLIFNYRYSEIKNFLSMFNSNEDIFNFRFIYEMRMSVVDILYTLIYTGIKTLIRKIEKKVEV